MKKLSKVEKTILEMNDRIKYDTYRCPDHGIYQIIKDSPEDQHCCIYCKKKHSKLSEQEIQKLLS